MIEFLGSAKYLKIMTSLHKQPLHNRTHWLLLLKKLNLSWIKLNPVMESLFLFTHQTYVDSIRSTKENYLKRVFLGPEIYACPAALLPNPMLYNQ